MPELDELPASSSVRRAGALERRGARRSIIAATEMTDTVTLADSVAVPAAVLSREVGGETVLLNLETGLYFGLDPVGTDIWLLLREGATLAEAAKRLVDTYDVNRLVLEADLLRLVTELAASGLVTVRPHTHPPAD